MKGRIHLRNMAFYGHHGHHPEETARGQRFFVDLVLTTDFSRPAASDALSDAVDYGAVYAVCREIVEENPVKLLETLCERLLSAVLDRFADVERVEVTVRKPSAPIPGVLDCVAAEAAASRADRPDRARQ